MSDEARMRAAASFPSQVWAVLRPGLAGVKRLVQRSVEQALHPSRRRAVKIRLARSGGWERALVLCYGNVCRSPYAASVLARALADFGSEMPVLQGGFIGPGRRSPVSARAVARARGTELRKHRSRLATPTDAQGQTLLVVMSPDQVTRVVRQLGVPRDRVVLLGDLDPHPITARTIRDPWGLEREVFEEVYERIERCTLALAECLRAGRFDPKPGAAQDHSGATTLDSVHRAAPGDDVGRIRSMQG